MEKFLETHITPQFNHEEKIWIDIASNKTESVITTLSLLRTSPETSTTHLKKNTKHFKKTKENTS